MVTGSKMSTTFDDSLFASGRQSINKSIYSHYYIHRLKDIGYIYIQLRGLIYCSTAILRQQYGCRRIDHKCDKRCHTNSFEINSELNYSRFVSPCCIQTSNLTYFSPPTFHQYRKSRRKSKKDLSTFSFMCCGLVVVSSWKADHHKTIDIAANSTRVIVYLGLLALIFFVIILHTFYVFFFTQTFNSVKYLNIIIISLLLILAILIYPYHFIYLY